MKRVLSPRARRITAVACLAAGFVCLLLAFLTLYLHANVWDERGFSRNAAEALQDPAVSAYVSDRLIEQIVENADEDLLAAQPVLEGVMPVVVRSDLFRPVFQRAAAQVHSSIFQADRADQGLVLDLSDIGIVLSGFLQGRRPELASEIPNQIRAAVIQVTREGPGPAVVTAARFSSWLVYVLPVLTVALFAAALVAARDRRRALVFVGVGVAGVALVVWIASAIAGSVLEDQVDVGDNRAAANGLLDAYLGSVPEWCLVLAGAGALLAAAAASALSAEELNARVRTGIRAIALTPKDEWARTLRGVLLVAVGALVLLEGEVAVRVATAIVGFYVVVLGLTELIRQAERFSTRAERRRGERRRIGVVATAAGILAIAGVSAGLVVAFTGGTETLVAVETEARCNGHAELCDRRLDEVVFPATHNSMSASSAGFVNANQSRGIVDQLDAGIRGFLIDAYEGRPGRYGRIATNFTQETRETAVREIGESGLQAIERIVGRIDVNDQATGTDTLYLCHVVCELGATDAVAAFTRIRQWLDDHPNEVLVFFVQDEGPTPAQMEEAFSTSGLFELVYTYRPPSDWPTLRQLIAENQRVFVLAEKGGVPGTWYHRGFDLFQETPYDTGTVAALSSDASCGPNRGQVGAPLFLLNNWVATYPPKPSNARIVNAYDFLLARALRCQEIRRHIPNLVAVDFYRRGDVVAVANTLNGFD